VSGSYARVCRAFALIGAGSDLSGGTSAVVCTTFAVVGGASAVIGRTSVSICRGFKTPGNSFPVNKIHAHADLNLCTRVRITRSCGVNSRAVTVQLPPPHAGSPGDASGSVEGLGRSFCTRGVNAW